MGKWILAYGFFAYEFKLKFLNNNNYSITTNIIKEKL